MITVSLARGMSAPILVLTRMTSRGASGLHARRAYLVWITYLAQDEAQELVLRYLHLLSHVCFCQNLRKRLIGTVVLRVLNHAGTNMLGQTSTRSECKCASGQCS